MEKEHRSRIREKFGHLNLPPIESLDIPDEYEFMNAELIELLKAGTEFHIRRLLGE